MRPFLILYASTSGSTRLVANLIATAFGSDATDLSDVAHTETEPEFTDRRLIVLASPTYGMGNCHSAWRERGAAILEGLPQGSPVALLCLADRRVHGSTFAGGLAELHALLLPKRPRLLGDVSAADYQFEHSPSVIDGRFPGLVVEYRRQRHRAVETVTEWAQRLLVETTPTVKSPSEPVS